MGEYLVHHGILGMHWGIRRYQPYPDGYKLKSNKKMVFKSTGELKKKLNSAEKTYAKNKAKWMRNDRKAKSTQNPAKEEKYKLKADEYKKLCKNGENYINDLLASGSKQGYSISVKSILRNGEKGRQYIYSSLFGIPGMIAYTTNANSYKKEYDEIPYAIKSYAYKVKDYR